MASEANLEQEFKFDVETAFDPPDLAGSRSMPAQHLLTVYFDTADRRLLSQGVTLRHRFEAAAGDAEPPALAGRAGKWTVKRPLPGRADGDAVVRQEDSWSASAGAVPEEALALLVGAVTAADLAEVAELASTRRRTSLHLPDGRMWAEVDDDTVKVRSGPRAGLEFRQVELELVDGVEVEPERPEAVAAAIKAAGGVPSSQSKFLLATGWKD